MPHDIQFTARQLQAIDLIKNHRVGIISGKPGTGKTTVLKQVLAWADNSGLTFSMAAPTGKAAKRMSESTDRDASTIHSLLGCEFDGNDGFKFYHNSENKFGDDLIIIDEMSMVTMDLFWDLLQAIDPRRTRLLLIGDPGQLPSIGAGAILRDLIASEVVPHVELDQIHRNCGAIVQACAAIHAGKLFKPAKKLDFDAENPVNLIHVEKSFDFEISKIIEKLVVEVLPGKKGFDPIKDIQVISPVNTRGMLSCEKLNRVLQVRLNPNADYGDGNGNESAQGDSDKDEPTRNRFFIGDKVIQTKNKHVPSAKKTDDGIDDDFKFPELSAGDEWIIDGKAKDIYIVNGDIGTVLDIYRGKLIIEFPDPERVVAIPLVDNQLMLAYAITCHRMQGSEVPVVVIPVHTSFQFFCNRQWIYTAISRARTACVLVGQFTAVPAMIRNVNGSDRKTMLAERLIDGFVSGMDI